MWGAGSPSNSPAPSRPPTPRKGRADRVVCRRSVVVWGQSFESARAWVGLGARPSPHPSPGGREGSVWVQSSPRNAAGAARICRHAAGSLRSSSRGPQGGWAPRAPARPGHFRSQRPHPPTPPPFTATARLGLPCCPHRSPSASRPLKGSGEGGRAPRHPRHAARGTRQEPDPDPPQTRKRPPHVLSGNALGAGPGGGATPALRVGVIA